MAERRLHGVLQRLRVMARDGRDASMDAELVGRFVAARDAAAFETLVRRYGPMVWGVCRRVLRDSHDAEDAFQATFLVLVRKAASVARRELLGNWLYGVAQRTALQARVSTARRRMKERKAAAMPRNDSAQPEAWREALPLLDQELARLPDSFRIPIILCDLQGKSRREAAHLLRLPEGTLSSPLARGRVRLARRLKGFGLAVSGGALAAALAANTASAAMPPLLAAATAKAAVSFAAGTIGAASIKAAALTEGVLKAMLWTKLKIATALLLTVGLLAAGAAATALRPQPARAVDTPKAAVRPAAAPGDKEPGEKPAADDGGRKEVSEAVARGLKWLALHQAPDGHWSLDRFQKFAHKKPAPDSETFTDDCTGEAQTKNDVAATAFGVLPFLAAGHTHKALEEKTEPDYHKTVKAGLDWLISQQGKDGAFDSMSAYANALAALAVCEAYGLTSDPALKGPAQRAVDYVTAAQDLAGGGWRYTPKTPGDLSVTGWQIGVLKSAQAAGLDVAKSALVKADKFLDSCETKTHGYSYLPGGPESPTMTAVGMLCRARLGADPRNAGLRAGADVLIASPPGKLGNSYYEYYAAQAMFHLGGDAWKDWNDGADGKGGTRAMLLAGQEHDPKKPCHDGSWASEDVWKPAGGRIMQTSLSLLILELDHSKSPDRPKAPDGPPEKP